ncbi:hypothetical protein [Nitrosospira sp. Nsp14]|uniref:hypothetical protein n=1 Tax=Nitrosospira sp. Nsp14 TaxID=1855333 RepID=UPI00116097DF|nr:hypothetical protein [Nitrosospira sp. Nsp14]
MPNHLVPCRAAPHAISLRDAVHLHAPARTQAYPTGRIPFPSLPFEHISSATSAGMGDADTL